MKENGMQIWFSPNDDKSPILADSILNITKKFLQHDNKRFNKKSDSAYYLLHKNNCTVCNGWMRFYEQYRGKQQPAKEIYQNKLAYLIMLGLNEYITEEL